MEMKMKKMFALAVQLFVTYMFAVFGIARLVHRKLRSYVVADIPRGTILRDVVDFGPLPGYSFKPNYMPVVQNCRMHYIDEGPKESKEIVLCLHGEPTWSYLYRKMVPIFTKAGYRVICPDFIGFGKSDKFANIADYSHEMHLECLKTLVDSLDLKNITLVVQDWGGLTGLSLLPDISARVSRIVVMNTGLPPLSKTDPTTYSGVANFITWRTFSWMCNTEIPVASVMKLACKGISNEEAAAYAKPFPTSIHRAGVAAWPLLVPLTKYSDLYSYMKKAHIHLKGWEKPALVMFSDKCPVTIGIDSYFKKILSTSGSGPGCTEPITIHKAGHFLQEDKGEEIAANIVDFMTNTK